jgi:hypothetical protein
MAFALEESSYFLIVQLDSWLRLAAVVVVDVVDVGAIVDVVAVAAAAAAAAVAALRVGLMFVVATVGPILGLLCDFVDIDLQTAAAAVAAAIVAAVEQYECAAAALRPVSGLSWSDIQPVGNSKQPSHFDSCLEAPGDSDSVAYEYCFSRWEKATEIPVVLAIEYLAIQHPVIA